MSVHTKYYEMPTPYSYFVMVQVGPLKLGNINLIKGDNESTPQVLQSFKITRLSSNTSTTENDNASAGALFEKAEFTFSLINRPQLERELINYVENSGTECMVTFRYGYVEGLKSPAYTGIISNLSLSSDMYTISMTVTYSPPGSNRTDFLPNTLKTITSKKYNRYSAIVTDIASLQGWNIGIIAGTKQISEDSIIYPDINDSPLSYINKILRGCVSENGEGGYIAEFIHNDGGFEEFNFRPSTFLVNGTSYRKKRDYNFVYGMLPNGNILSFTPTLTNGLAAVNKSTYISDSEDIPHTNKDSNIFGVITKDTKEFTSVKYNIGTSDENALNILNANDNVVVASKSSIMLNSLFSDVENYAESIIKNDISTYAYSTAMNPTANMEILGDPDLKLMDYINVLPMYPAKSSGSGGIMHPSGGTYRIKQIVDSISGGKYTTSLSLVKENNTMLLSKLTNEPYKKPVAPDPPVVPEQPKTFKVGDRVHFTGSTHYVSSYPGSKGYRAHEGWATITIINQKLLTTPGAHPYHLIHEGAYSSTNNLYGWVNEGDFGFN